MRACFQRSRVTGFTRRGRGYTWRRPATAAATFTLARGFIWHLPIEMMMIARRLRVGRLGRRLDVVVVHLVGAAQIALRRAVRGAQAARGGGAGGAAESRWDTTGHQARILRWPWSCGGYNEEELWSARSPAHLGQSAFGQGTISQQRKIGLSPSRRPYAPSRWPTCRSRRLHRPAASAPLASSSSSLARRPSYGGIQRPPGSGRPRHGRRAPGRRAEKRLHVAGAATTAGQGGVRDAHARSRAGLRVRRPRRPGGGRVPDPLRRAVRRAVPAVPRARAVPRGEPESRGHVRDAQDRPRREPQLVWRRENRVQRGGWRSWIATSAARRRAARGAARRAAHGAPRARADRRRRLCVRRLRRRRRRQLPGALRVADDGSCIDAWRRCLAHHECAVVAFNDQGDVGDAEDRRAQRRVAAARQRRRRGGVARRVRAAPDRCAPPESGGGGA